MPTFEAGQIVTVFRSRRSDAHADEYVETAARMVELAHQMPGFVDYKTFVADDGERVALVTFESMETQKGWRHHGEHSAAQRAGRDRFYEGYSLQVCECLQVSQFTA
jgi:heme-degrading monooxygenase HmoA